MIRVNLLPQKRRQAAAGGEIWAVATIAVIAVQIVGCLVLYGFKKDELERIQQDNEGLSSQIQQVKAASKNHADVKNKLAVLRKREEAISKLQSARTGPTAMLLEVARMLTPGRGPTVDPDRLAKLRRENPLSDFNPNWDTRRLWLVRFVESDRQVQLEGLARDGEDVSELARRMSLSSYFYDVALLPARRGVEDSSGVPMVSFKLEAKVRY